jgi:hypothetical protein
VQVLVANLYNQNRIFTSINLQGCFLLASPAKWKKGEKSGVGCVARRCGENKFSNDGKLSFRSKTFNTLPSQQSCIDWSQKNKIITLISFKLTACGLFWRFFQPCADGTKQNTERKAP